MMENESTMKSIDEEIDGADSLGIDLDEFAHELQDEIDKALMNADILEKDRGIMENPKLLGESIKNIVWEQFLNQLGFNAADDFIVDNNGLNLDLRDEAHIQDAENFANGNIATHNTKIDFQKRYDDWQAIFEKNPDGFIKMHTTRTGAQEANLVKGARQRFDADRPKGSVEKHTDMDHTVSAGEIIRDPKANAFLSKEEQVAFANSKQNLNEIDASVNRAKGDMSVGDFLNNPNANGQKPREIYQNLDEKGLIKKDKEARAEYEKRKNEGEREAIANGKQSQREEALKVGKHTAKAVIISLLSALLKEMVDSLVRWIRSEERSLKTLLLSFRSAIFSFVRNLKYHLINAADVAITVIAGAILGPIVRIIKRVWMILKQGVRSLKQTIDYIKDPANANKPSDIRTLEIGKIIVAGASAVEGILLTQAIEVGLISIGEVCPALIVEIPVIGSLASVISIFAGGLTAGIVGALFMLAIDRTIERKRLEDTDGMLIDAGNSIMGKQRELIQVKCMQMQMVRNKSVNDIVERHKDADQKLKEVYDCIKDSTGGGVNLNMIDDSVSDVWKRLSNI